MLSSGQGHCGKRRGAIPSPGPGDLPTRYLAREAVFFAAVFFVVDDFLPVAFAAAVRFTGAAFFPAGRRVEDVESPAGRARSAVG